MNNKFISASLLILSMSSSYAEIFNPTPSNDVLNNPHRGYMLWGSNVLSDEGLPDNFNGANIYHVYVPWRMIETADQVFDWSDVEQNDNFYNELF